MISPQQPIQTNASAYRWRYQYCLTLKFISSTVLLYQPITSVLPSFLENKQSLSELMPYRRLDAHIDKWTH